MTDNTETAAAPDPRAIAQAVLLEVADEPEQVGNFVEAIELEDHVTDFRFQAAVRGYEGWQWSVTLFHDIELDSWTVNESSLVPTDSALMPPKWVPWKDRLEPTDLSPTDSIGTDPDDERIEPGEVEESSLEDVNDAVQTFRLTRRHVLSPLGRAQAAKRWYEGPRGPKALSTKTAEGNLCSTCGFFVPLTGELDRMFGVCANKWSPDDGRVVSLDHGCGEHSEIEPPEPSHLWVQSKPAFDDMHVDVVASASHRKGQATDDDAEDEESVEEALSGVIADAAAATAAQDATTNDIDGVDDIDERNDDSEVAPVSEDEEDDADSDEATEEDILLNTEPDSDDDDLDDESDEDPEGIVTVDDDVAPGLEAVVDLIEQLRQAKAESMASDEDDDDEDSDVVADSGESEEPVDSDDSDESDALEDAAGSDDDDDAGLDNVDDSGDFDESKVGEFDEPDVNFADEPDAAETVNDAESVEAGVSDPSTEAAESTGHDTAVEMDGTDHDEAAEDHAAETDSANSR
ncbi:DUF3027 domain-containing protein [Bifidobacterium callitrichidarum]|uniref:DUF3027 domain-containing protein n=1 Tax=Bifidobacterium callitrichidarum TaxID=2052941 RepID=A0A2U2NB77_9BIFI|nr:DUF3027 domain-containing protein [Bifidobacterium callitrichidarum]